MVAKGWNMLDPQLIYIAVFNRPADPAGLAWVNELTQGGTKYEAMAGLTGTVEYTMNFNGLEAAETISRFYESLFSRLPEEAGLQYWVSNFTPHPDGSGAAFSPANLVFAMVEAAQGHDADTLAAKVEVASYITSLLDTPDEVAAYEGRGAGVFGRGMVSQTDWENIPTHAEIDAGWKEHFDSWAQYNF